MPHNIQLQRIAFNVCACAALATVCPLRGLLRIVARLMRNVRRRFMGRLILLLVLALLAGVGIFYVKPFGSPNWNAMSRLMGWQIFRIPSSAMEPTFARNSTIRICYPEIS